MKSLVALFAFLFVFSLGAFAQKTDNLPVAFILGEHAEEYDAMTQDYSQMLLGACDNDMQVAYDKWMSMLKEMEAFAEKTKFNLDGIHLWLNIFCDKDGSINHITFYTKPESKVVPMNELTAFFKLFAKDYKFPLIANDKYVHYGHASFPTAPKRLAKK